jgi:hypothetical protein
VNQDADAVGAANAGEVSELTAAAQRALAGRIIWTPADATAAVRTELLTLWPEVSPEGVRDTLMEAAELALANGVTSSPESVAIWAAEAMLSAVYRSRNPEPLPGFFTPPELATLLASDETPDTETLEALSVLLALAYTPGASCWRPR